MRKLLLLVAVTTSACAARTALSPVECHHALSLFAEGKSMSDIQSEMHLEDRAQARELVHDAMIEMTRRYWRAQ